MKKLLYIVTCFMLMISLLGCSSNTITDNTEIYKMLSEQGYSFDLSYSYYSSTPSYDLRLSNAYDENKSIWFHCFLMEDNVTWMAITNVFINESNLDIVDNGEETWKTVGKKYGCSIDLISEEAQTDCTETQYVDAKMAKEEINKYFKEINVNPDDLHNFLKWYVEENQEYT